MNSLSLLFGVLKGSKLAFQVVRERKPVALAGFLALLPPVVGALAVLLIGKQEAEPNLGLTVVFGVAIAAVGWLVMAGLINALANHIGKGQGSLATALSVVGLADLIVSIGVIIGAIVQHGPIAQVLGDHSLLLAMALSVIFFLWFMTVVIIGVRECYEVSFGMALLAVVGALFVSQLVLSTANMFVSPYTGPPPFQGKLAKEIPQFERTSNLVENPGFEEGEDQPMAWSARLTSFPPGARRERTTQVFHSGKASAYMRQPVIGQVNAWLQLVPYVTPERKFAFSAWLKFRDCRAVLLVVVFRDKDEKVLDLACSGAIKGSSDWKQYAITGKVPPKAASALVEIGLWGGGEFWADDVDFRVDGQASREPPGAKKKTNGSKGKKGGKDEKLKKHKKDEGQKGEKGASPQKASSQ